MCQRGNPGMRLAWREQNSNWKIKKLFYFCSGAQEAYIRIRGGKFSGRKGGKRFFFEKKNQKTFVFRQGA
jgi:hypothetical protein